MARVRISATLEEAQVRKIRKLIAEGATSSVSAFVEHAVAVSLADAAGWDKVLEEALCETGGPLTAKERAWVDAALNPASPKRKRRAA